MPLEFVGRRTTGRVERVGRASSGWALALALGCGSDEPPSATLTLSGPAEVRTELLGPVEGPRAALSDGTEPAGVSWVVAPDSVAAVGADGRVEARAPGTAVVTGTWNDQAVQWTLIVAPAVALRFVEPPERVAVGAVVGLKLEGRVGDQVVEPGAITWTSSDPAVLEVAAGQATGRAAGLVYVTAEGATGSRATLELRVE